MCKLCLGGRLHIKNFIKFRFSNGNWLNGITIGTGGGGDFVLGKLLSPYNPVNCMVLLESGL